MAACKNTMGHLSETFNADGSEHDNYMYMYIHCMHLYGMMCVEKLC